MTEQQTTGDTPPSGARVHSVRIVFAALMLVMLLASLDQTIVSTARPTIVGELAGLAPLSWIVTAYLLATTIVTPLYGKPGDLLGRKVVLQSAILLFLAGSALCGMSRSMLELIVFRALQGLGGGAAELALDLLCQPSTRARVRRGDPLDLSQAGVPQPPAN